MPGNVGRMGLRARNKVGDPPPQSQKYGIETETIDRSAECAGPPMRSHCWSVSDQKKSAGHSKSPAVDSLSKRMETVAGRFSIKFLGLKAIGLAGETHIRRSGYWQLAGR